VQIDGQHHERLKESRMQYEMVGDIPVRGNKLLVVLLIFILQDFGQRLIPRNRLVNERTEPRVQLRKGFGVSQRAKLSELGVRHRRLVLQ